MNVDMSRIVADILCGEYGDMCCFANNNWAVFDKTKLWIQSIGLANTRTMIRLICCPGVIRPARSSPSPPSTGYPLSMTRLIGEIECGYHQDMCCLINNNFAALETFEDWTIGFGYGKTKKLIELRCVCEKEQIKPPPPCIPGSLECPLPPAKKKCVPGEPECPLPPPPTGCPEGGGGTLPAAGTYGHSLDYKAVG